MVSCVVADVARRLVTEFFFGSTLGWFLVFFVCLERDFGCRDEKKNDDDDEVVHLAIEAATTGWGRGLPSFGYRVLEFRPRKGPMNEREREPRAGGPSGRHKSLLIRRCAAAAAAAAVVGEFIYALFFRFYFSLLSPSLLARLARFFLGPRRPLRYVRLMATRWPSLMEFFSSSSLRFSPSRVGLGVGSRLTSRQRQRRRPAA